MILLTWVLLGTIYLLISAFQDVKYWKETGKGFFDDRHNYLMFGLTIGTVLQLFGSLNLFYLISASIASALMFAFLKMIKGLGDGDAKATAWITYGLIIVDLKYYALFFGFMFVIGIAYFYFFKWLTKTEKPIPFMPSIATSFIITSSYMIYDLILNAKII